MALAAAAGACSAGEKSHPVIAHIWTGSAARSGNATGFQKPVAIANVGGDDFVLANYSEVALFNTSTGTIDKIDVDNPEIVKEFVPTSLAIDRAHGKLLIANYLSNNVIVASLDIAKRRLRLERLIGDEHTISPEGVAISGDMVGVANYDGGNVQFFDQSKPDSAAVCTVPVPEARGVTFQGDLAYATSLQDRSLLKIDPKICAVLARVGATGWEPKQFLWPTQVASWDARSVAVTDAHTGLISVYDVKTLEFVKSFGGNGPGQNELNMPYALAVGASDLLVASTFGDRILRFDKATGRPTESWSLAPAWEKLADGSPYTLNHEGRDGYVDTHTTVTVDGACYHPGYDELQACSAGDNIELSASPDQEMYFLQVARFGDQTLIFSPHIPIAVLFGAGGWATRREVPIGIDHWLIDGRVVGPDGVAFRFDTGSAATSEPQ